MLAGFAHNALAVLRRHRAPAWTRRALQPVPKENPKRVLVTGATGFIGRHLVYRLVERGDEVIVLARDRGKATDLFGPHARVVTEIDAIEDTEWIDAIVNLAGAPLAARPWTERRKKTLLESRLAVTEALVALAARLERKPVTWINASAVGYYGVRNDDVPLHEKAAPQPIFQSELCRRWESCAVRAAEHGAKVALLRMGVVLGRDGGALAALARPARLGLGVIFGTGAQWVSWIHLHDLLELMLFVLDQETLAGPVNATAPTPLRQAELAEAIAAALRVPHVRIRIPGRVLRAALGELAQFFADGQRVVPERATALGFRFRHATAGDALESLLARPQPGAVVAPNAS